MKFGDVENIAEFLLGRALMSCLDAGSRGGSSVAVRAVDREREKKFELDN